MQEYNKKILLHHQSKHSKTSSYSNYLLSVNLLVINFLQDKDYTQQVHHIETIELPPKIKNILLDLHNYSENYLFNNNIELIKIFPKTNCWIEKFVKIKKKSDTIKNKEKLKFKIIANLNFFVNFFYSQELQQNL